MSVLIDAFSGDTEVDHVDRVPVVCSGASKHEVGRFDVAMDEASAVEVSDRVKAPRCTVVGRVWAE